MNPNMELGIIIVGIVAVYLFARHHNKTAATPAAHPEGIGQWTPKTLADTPIQGPRMHGRPGAKLDASTFDQASIQAGQAGEATLARALNKAGLTRHAETIWSASMPVSMPRNGHAVPDSRYRSDIDLIAITGTTIWLADAKMWKGDRTWSQHGEGAVTDSQGTVHKLSRNMLAATERIQRLLPKTRISPMVVVVPSDAGPSRVAPGTHAPGNIPVVTMAEAIGRIAADTNRPPMAKAIRMLAPLANS